MFSSSRMCASSRVTAPAAARSGARTRSRGRGWRTRTREALRAARPRVTTRWAASKSAMSASSFFASSASGHAATWTLAGASGRTDRTRFEWTASAVNGMNGAIIRFVASRHS